MTTQPTTASPATVHAAGVGLLRDQQLKSRICVYHALPDLPDSIAPMTVIEGYQFVYITLVPALPNWMQAMVAGGVLRPVVRINTRYFQHKPAENYLGLEWVYRPNVDDQGRTLLPGHVVYMTGGGEIQTSSPSIMVTETPAGHTGPQITPLERPDEVTYLMSRTNPDGPTLNEVCDRLIDDLICKTYWVLGVTKDPMSTIVTNNLAEIDRLREIKDIHLKSMEMMNLLGPDLGPQNPRA